jgi:hypothetical protein
MSPRKQSKSPTTTTGGKSPTKQTTTTTTTTTVKSGGKTSVETKSKINAFGLQFVAFYLIVLGVWGIFGLKHMLEFHGAIMTPVSPLELLLMRSFGMYCVVHGYGLFVASREPLYAQRKALQLDMLRQLITLPLIASESHKWGADPKTSLAMRSWVGFLLVQLALEIWACYYQ